MGIQKLIIISDACCRIQDAHQQGRSSRGESACGVLFLSPTKDISCLVGEEGQYLGLRTVPEAEYLGLIFALEQARNFAASTIEVWLDSELVVKQVNGEYRVNMEHLKALHHQVKELETQFKQVRYTHHKRTDPLAQRADQKANETLDRHLTMQSS